MIKSFLGRAIPALAMTCLASGMAFAGPLEDGVAAYTRADYAAAMRLLKPLAEKGNSDAQYLLGGMYHKGQGVSEDKVRAYLYYDLAARAGDEDAGGERDRVASDMTPEQVEEAKKRAAEWKAQ